jgi:hypothetical protein
MRAVEEGVLLEGGDEVPGNAMSYQPGYSTA